MNSNKLTSLIRLHSFYKKQYGENLFDLTFLGIEKKKNKKEVIR